MNPDAYDWSWAHMPAAVAKRHSARVIYGYLSWDTSKNMTSAEVKAHHQLGIGVVLGWESMPGRPLLGAGAGHDDAKEALAQLVQHERNIGYKPAALVAVPFSMDQDVQPGQYGAVLAYLQAADKVLRTSGRYCASIYGHAAIVDYLAGHGFTLGQFQTYAWSGGAISRHASLYQFHNGQTVEGYSVDFDRVLNDRTLHCWWPPNHPLNKPNTPAPDSNNTKEQQMIRLRAQVAALQAWQKLAMRRNKIRDQRLTRLEKAVFHGGKR